MSIARTGAALTIAVGALALLIAVPASAQDLEGCDSFQRFIDREDYPRALEELGWCRNSVTELHYAKIKEIVDRTVMGYEAHGATAEAALGFAMVEAEYSNGSDEITLSITGGAEAGAQATAGLGALAGLASAFGVRPEGTRQVRVAGLTGQMAQDGGEAKLTLTMDGGTIITITGPDADTVEAFAEEIIPDLEDYLG